MHSSCGVGPPKNVVNDAAAEQWAIFHRLFGEATKVEQVLRRKKKFKPHSLDRVAKLKARINCVVKVLGAMKGMRSEWSSVIQAWRQLTRDFPGNIEKALGIVSFLIKREVVEVSKFGKLDGVAELMHFEKGGWGLFTLAPEDLCNSRVRGST